MTCVIFFVRLDHREFISITSKSFDVFFSQRHRLRLFYENILRNIDGLELFSAFINRGKLKLKPKRSWQGSSNVTW